MTIYRVTVTRLGGDHINTGGAPLEEILTEEIELDPTWLAPEAGPREVAIAVLLEIDGAECPFDCDKCREED